MLFACSQTPPSLLVYIGPIMGAFVALMIGAGGLWIAHWQMRVAREKLKADLFDRRFAIFNVLDQMPSRVLRGDLGGREPHNAALEAMATFPALPFLFGPEIEQYGRSLVAKVHNVIAHAHIVAVSSSHSSEEAIAIHERSDRIREDMLLMHATIGTTFAPYLRLEDFAKRPAGLRRRLPRT